MAAQNIKRKIGKATLLTVNPNLFKMKMGPIKIQTPMAGASNIFWIGLMFLLQTVKNEYPIKNH